ncbi:hypothetical protein ACFLXI_05270 [Chloroflexota bacterium]
MKDRRVLITCLVLLLVACLGIGCASLIGVGINFYNSSFSDTAFVSEETSDLQEDPQLNPEMGSEYSETPYSSHDKSPNQPLAVTAIDPESARQMDEIQMQVIMERGLKPTGSIERKLYSHEDFREKIIQDFFGDYSPEDARIEALTFTSFGLLQPDYDLYTLYTDLYSEQIGGFFDTETKEMVVVQDEGFGGVERFVYAHEYTHVLQDQNFDLENGLTFNDEDCEAETERCSAILALIEGDATITQSRWFFSNATTEDQAELLQLMVEETKMPVFNSAPEFITLGLTFPYEYGYHFVDHLYNIGGWGTIDRAYQIPPLSTEQIMHPDRYPDDKPILVSLPALEEILGTGWEELDRGVMGEWSTYLILAKGLDENARIDENQAKSAVQGWGGDAYVVYNKSDTGETVMIMHSVWDSPSDADEFAKSFRDYADGRFGSSTSNTWQGLDGYHIFIHETDSTTWILAPDPNIATTVWQTLSP